MITVTPETPRVSRRNEFELNKKKSAETAVDPQLDTWRVYDTESSISMQIVNGLKHNYKKTKQKNHKRAGTYQRALESNKSKEMDLNDLIFTNHLNTMLTSN